MRADVSGPSARRALGSVCAGAAALLQEDGDGLDLVLAEMRLTSSTADVVDAALLTSAEIFTQIADLRSMPPSRLTSVLATALGELSSELPAASLFLLSAYLEDDFDGFSDGCETLVEAHEPAALVRSCLEVLAGALRWRAQDQGVLAVDAARSLCLSVARFSQEDS